MPTRILYGQVREDPAVDLEALRIGPGDRVLAVTSGGCTALRLLAEGPERLTCVDLNPAQNHLLELKLAAIRRLPNERCRAFLGARPSPDRLLDYRRIAGDLSAPARRFWDRHPGLIRRGALNSGRTEQMVPWLARLLFGWVHPPRRVRDLFRQPDLASQRAFYREIWCNDRWRRVLRTAFHPMVFRLMYGRSFTRRWTDGDLTAAWTAKIERAFEEIPARSNEFLSQLLWGRYLPGEDGLPSFLRAGVMERIRAHADRLECVTADLADTLGRAGEGAFTKATLSNALEWFPAARVPAAFSGLARSLKPGGRAVLRHLLAVTPLQGTTLLREEVELSDRLTRQERAFLYTRVSVYDRL